jgi:hypothetical protein
MIVGDFFDFTAVLVTENDNFKLVTAQSGGV